MFSLNGMTETGILCSILVAGKSPRFGVLLAFGDVPDIPLLALSLS